MSPSAMDFVHYKNRLRILDTNYGRASRRMARDSSLRTERRPCLRERVGETTGHRQQVSRVRRDDGRSH